MMRSWWVHLVSSEMSIGGFVGKRPETVNIQEKTF